MGTQSSVAVLSARLTRLERANRRMKTLVLGGVLLAAAFLSAGMAGQKRIVQADAIELFDEQGKLRVMLSHKAGLSLLDGDGRPRAVLSLDHEGPGLALYGTSSRLGAAMNVNADGPALVMRGKEGETRALLAVIDDGPGLVLFDAHGRERAAAVARRDGASFTLLDEKGESIWNAPGKLRAAP